MKRNGAQIVAKVLLEQGVDTVFGYPGGQVLALYEALYQNRDRIHHVLTAHEQGAAHAADGYARATGCPGVVIATSGPGATNLVTGIATAYLDSSPLVAITGNVSRALIGTDQFQEVDTWGITMPITKHNYLVQDVAELADVLREAFAIATSGRPGPVLVDIPRDVQEALWDYHPAPAPIRPPKPIAAEEALTAAAKLLRASKRPYCYCGGGVVAQDAGTALLALADRIDAVIGCSVMGLSAVPDDSARKLGMQGIYGRHAATCAMAQADLILAVGVRFSDRGAADERASVPVIHIDIDAAELDKNIPARLAILGDAGDALRRLTALLPEQHHPRWQASVAAWKREEAAALPQNAFSPYAVIRAVQQAAGREAIVATDVGQHQMLVARHYALFAPRTLITSGGLGTMGFGMGAAIGAALGTGKRVVLFAGDGGFAMSAAELATAVSLHLPIVIVLFHNGTLGMVRQTQTEQYHAHYAATDLPQTTDFVLLARAYGARSYAVCHAEALAQVVEAAFAADAPVLLDCRFGKDDTQLCTEQSTEKEA